MNSAALEAELRAQIRSLSREVALLRDATGSQVAEFDVNDSVWRCPNEDCRREVTDYVCDFCGLQVIFPENEHPGHTGDDTGPLSCSEDRNPAIRGSTPTIFVERTVGSEDLARWRYMGREDGEFLTLLSRGATALMCFTFSLTYSDEEGIIAYADQELFDTFSGPAMRHGDHWAIHLGRRVELDEDDLDGSFIEALLEDAIMFPLRDRQWHTVFIDSPAYRTWVTKLKDVPEDRDSEIEDMDQGSNWEEETQYDGTEPIILDYQLSWVVDEATVTLLENKRYYMELREGAERIKETFLSGPPNWDEIDMPNLERKLKIFADRTEMAAPSGADKADILGFANLVETVYKLQMLRSCPAHIRVICWDLLQKWYEDIPLAESSEEVVMSISDNEENEENEPVLRRDSYRDETPCPDDADALMRLERRTAVSSILDPDGYWFLEEDDADDPDYQEHDQIDQESTQESDQHPGQLEDSANLLHAIEQLGDVVDMDSDFDSDSDAPGSGWNSDEVLSGDEDVMRK